MSMKRLRRWLAMVLVLALCLSLTPISARENDETAASGTAETGNGGAENSSAENDGAQNVGTVSATTGEAWADSLYGTWSGTYAGTLNGEPVERTLVLNIDLVTLKSDGGASFEGTATLDNGTNGRYLLAGEAYQEGTISFEGIEWIEHPNNFSLANFSGVWTPDAGTMSGYVGYDSERPFSLTKTSSDYESSRIDLAEVPREWDGEYDGHSGEVVVRRLYEFHIQSMDADGSIRGVAIFAPSDKAEAVYGRNGSYYFSGKINARTGRITMQGYEWIEYPVGGSEDNWEFVYLDGVIAKEEGGTFIHGFTEDGIWEMAAIDYSAINMTSGFTLGRDNNNFVHTDSRNWDGAGFVGTTNLMLDDAYFSALTIGSSQGEINMLKKIMRRSWNGSCYGIAMSMGLLYEGYIGLSDLTSQDASSYFTMVYPSEDTQLHNMITYFQLSQYKEVGGVDDATVSASYNHGFLTGLSNWLYGYDSLPVFLKKLVDAIEKDHVIMLGYSTSHGGHAILVTGLDYNESRNRYEIQLYDENSVDSSTDRGEFITMSVAQDFSTFSFTDANGGLVSNKTYKSIYFLDWDSLGSVISPVSGDYTDHTRLIFPYDSAFRVENADGQYLEYDGEAFSGDLPIYGISSMNDDADSRIVLTTANTSELKVTDIAGDLDLETCQNDTYTAVKGTSIDGAVLGMDGGVSLTGENMQFEAYLTTDAISDTELGLTSVSAKAASDVSLTTEGSSVTVASDAEVTNVTTGTYAGTTATERYFINNENTFTVDGEGAVDGATEVAAPVELLTGEDFAEISLPLGTTIPVDLDFDGEMDSLTFDVLESGEIGYVAALANGESWTISVVGERSAADPAEENADAPAVNTEKMTRPVPMGRYVIFRNGEYLCAAAAVWTTGYVPYLDYTVWAKPFGTDEPMQQVAEDGSLAFVSELASEEDWLDETISRPVLIIQNGNGTFADQYYYTDATIEFAGQLAKILAGSETVEGVGDPIYPMLRDVSFPFSIERLAREDEQGYYLMIGRKVTSSWGATEFAGSTFAAYEIVTGESGETLIASGVLVRFDPNPDMLTK